MSKVIISKRYVIERLQSSNICDLVVWFLYDTENAVELIRCRTKADVVMFAWEKGISFDDVMFIYNL